MHRSFEGIVVPVVTPIDSSEQVDRGALLALLEFLIEHGVHGIMPLGSQGEFFALSSEEKHAVIDLVVSHVNGRVPVIVHIGEIATGACIALSKHARTCGADAISVITPFYIKPNQQELYYHYKEIAEAVSLPVFAYNNPRRTDVNLSPETVARLASDIPNFVGIKDSSSDLTQMAEYVGRCPEGFRIFVGHDCLIYDGLMCGAVGAIAASANVVPDLVVSIYAAVKTGQYQRAKELQRKLAPLREAFSLGSFPVVIKDAMEIIGLPAGSTRRPIRSLAGEEREQLRATLEDMGAL